MPINPPSHEHPIYTLLSVKNWVIFIVSVSMLGRLQRPPLFPINLTYFGFFMVFVLTGRDLFQNRLQRRVKWELMDILVFVFLLIIWISAFLGTLFYNMPFAVFGNNAILTFMGILILYFITRIYFQNVSDIVQLFKISGLLLSVISIVSVLLIVKQPYQFINASNDFIDMTLVDVHSWEEGTRLSGVTGNPNGFATYLILYIPILTTLIVIEQSYWKKIFSLALVMTLFIALGFTFSRSAFLAIFIAIPLLIVFLVKLTPALRLIISVLIITLFAFLLIMWLFPDLSTLVKMRLFMISSTELEYRDLLWAEAFKLFQHYPLGVGYSNFREATLLTSDVVYAVQGRSAHNSLVVTMVELGFWGLFTFGAIILKSISPLWLVFHNFNEKNIYTTYQILLIGLTISLLALWIHVQAHSTHAIIQVWVILACQTTLAQFLLVNNHE